MAEEVDYTGGGQSWQNSLNQTPSWVNQGEEAEVIVKKEEEEEELDEFGNPIVKQPGMQADGTFGPYNQNAQGGLLGQVLGNGNGSTPTTTEKPTGLQKGKEGVDFVATAFGGAGVKDMGIELMKGPSYTYKMFGEE